MIDKHSSRRLGLAAIVLLLTLLCACGSDDGGGRERVVTWAMAPHAIDPLLPGRPDARFQIDDQTIRQVIRVGVGGKRLRVKLSNLFGTDALRIDAASIAHAASPTAVDASSLTPIQFGGASGVTIAPGDEIVSDPIEMTAAPLAELAVSLYFGSPSYLTTMHFTSLRDSFVSAGDQTLREDLPAPSRLRPWVVMTGLEAELDSRPAVIVALGDSITDGFGSQQASGSWPERLAQRMRGEASVLNVGISGNRILRSGISLFGPAALDRFERDVLRQAGVTTVIVQEGINDIQAPAVPNVFGDDPPSPPVTSADLIAGLRELIRRSKDAGLVVIGGTLLPYEALAAIVEGGEETRREVNEWIRHSGELDAVIDFEAATHDPENPQRLLPAYDSGDGLHPNDAGYRAMADAAFEVIDRLK